MSFLALACRLFGHSLVHVADDYCDATCDLHVADCQQNLPITACARCGVTLRKGRVHTMEWFYIPEDERIG